MAIVGPWHLMARSMVKSEAKHMQWLITKTEKAILQNMNDHTFNLRYTWKNILKLKEMNFLLGGRYMTNTSIIENEHLWGCKKCISQANMKMNSLVADLPTKPDVPDAMGPTCRSVIFLTKWQLSCVLKIRVHIQLWLLPHDQQLLNIKGKHMFMSNLPKLLSYDNTFANLQV
jgi:hypothetical protein